jgi:cysteinyl-tRNA synthetase
MQLFNTLTRQKMPFEPRKPDKVGLYCCGPTVYHFAHIGNLRAYIFEDLLRRALEFEGYEVKHVMNITDVGHLTSDADEGEDKMLKGAKRENKTVWQVAEYYAEAFMADMKALNLLHPTIVCKATDHIKEMIDLIKRLEANGMTYSSKGNVYFDTSKLSDYGKLAQLDKQQLEAGKRIEVDPNKKNPHDFVLWFTKSKFLGSPELAEGGDQEMKWESPWGRGYPGWHIECSAMSMKYLGEQFDIHCGGIDHIPVHHTNELAQSEGATNKKPWVLYWMHSNFLVLREEGTEARHYPFDQICDKCGFKNVINEHQHKTNVGREKFFIVCENCHHKFDAKYAVTKMAKSADNFLRIQTLIDKGYSALDYRYFCLNAHYRKELTFSWEGMDSAKKSLSRLRQKVEELGEAEGKVDKSHLKTFEAAISDDLNMPQALAETWGLIEDSKVNKKDKLSTILKFDEVLGLKLDEPIEFKVSNDVESLVLERNAARKAKDWKRSDELRVEIEKAGYLVKDGPKGTEIQPK